MISPSLPRKKVVIPGRGHSSRARNPGTQVYDVQSRAGVHGFRAWPCGAAPAGVHGFRVWPYGAIPE
jgi:hypothetical protein